MSAWGVCESCGTKSGVLCDGVCGRCSVCDGCGEWTLHLRDGWCLTCHAKYASEEIQKVEREHIHQHEFDIAKHFASQSYE